MASMSPLDQDLRQMRLDRYTPQAAQELRSWIEKTLGESLPAGDVLDSLKDGVALCKLANLVLAPPGIRFKASNMPFTQRENIAQFLRACEMPPLNMPAHDRFLTVDLYDNKDPAQVIQCLGAFSRAAHAANPSRFPHVIGPKKGAAPASPTRRFASVERSPAPPSPRARGTSPTRAGASSPSRSVDLGRKATVSSWSNKSDESSTAPAWNIHQYGYMGGASQGNQGISFGARRQITSQSPSVPSVAEKEKMRRERDAEESKRQQQEEASRQYRAQRLREEEEAQRAEERRWEEETQKRLEAERQEVERQKRKWEEEERRWREEEEARKREEQQSVQSNKTPTSELRGQYLSEYNASRRSGQSTNATLDQQAQTDRVRELERQLEEARERERQYQLERGQQGTPVSGATSARPAKVSGAESEGQQTHEVSSEPEYHPQEDSIVSEQDYLQPQASQNVESSTPRPLPTPQPRPTEPAAVEGTPTPAAAPVQLPSEEQQRGAQPKSQEPARTLTFSSRPSPFSKPTPAPKPFTPPTSKPTPATNSSPRPLPESPYAAARSPFAARTERFLSSNPAPAPARDAVQSHTPAEFAGSSSTERAAEDARRQAGQQQTKAGGWASKSLLEREMERERERQREWEEEELAKARANGSSGERKVMGPRGMGAR